MAASAAPVSERLTSPGAPVSHAQLPARGRFEAERLGSGFDAPSGVDGLGGTASHDHGAAFTNEHDSITVPAARRAVIAMRSPSTATSTKWCTLSNDCVSGACASRG